jgi:hypothetical protein
MSCEIERGYRGATRMRVEAVFAPVAKDGRFVARFV